MTLLFALAWLHTSDATTILIPTQSPSVEDALQTLTGPGPHTIEIEDSATYVASSTLDIGSADITIQSSGASPPTLEGPGGVELFRVDGGSLSLVGVVLSGSSDPDVCIPTGTRGIVALNATVQAIDAVLWCFEGDDGGAIHAQDTVVVLDGSWLHHNVATGRGGAVYATNGDVTADGVLVEDNEAWIGGGLHIEGATGLVVRGTYCGNSADLGGGLHAEYSPTLTALNNVFDGNRATNGGAGLSIAGDQLGSAVHNNTFSGNQAGIDEAGVTVALGSGGAARIEGTVVDFRNNLVAHQLAGGGVSGIEGAAFTIGDPLSFGFNLFYGNCDSPGCDPLLSTHLSGAFAGTVLDTTNVVDVDPLMAYAGAGDFDCTNDAVWPIWGSPAVDRGDDTAPSFADIDGSRNDIGYTGGSAAGVLDRDGDGYHNLLDCDDLDPNTSPGAFEVCDLADNDCDGSIDEGFDTTWYEDADGDGYGTTDFAAPVLVQCVPEPGYSTTPGDCDDQDVSVNPGAIEVCNAVDDNCNGVVDDDDLLSYQTYYPDGDGDSYGRSTGEALLCADPGPGWSWVSGDCNDTDATMFPGAVEICDALDNDCDAMVDDNAVDALSGYNDYDGDGYGHGELIVSCNPADTWAFIDGDCDNSDAEVHPGATEVCDGIDNDCDGEIDVDAVDQTLWYFDRDGDGLVDANSEILACERPNDRMRRADPSLDLPYDCDDGNPRTGPCRSGCGCATSSGGSAPAALLLAGLLAFRRRRLA